MKQENENSTHGLKQRIASVGFAITGISELLKSEPNARIHLAATIGAVALGFLLKISTVEWCIVVLAISMVWAAEAFNTVAEKLCDRLIPEQNEQVRNIKDVAAGAVLICAFGALVCGLIVFLPRILEIF